MAFDENGLVVPRYNEILQDIEDAQRTTIPQRFKYQNNKLIYQLNSVYARSADQIAQLVEAAFDSIRLSSAEGNNLDELGFIRDVVRLQPAPSQTTTQYAWLPPGTVIPAGTQFSSSTVDDVANTVETVTADQDALASAIITVDTVEDEETYNFVVNNVMFAYVSEVGDTAEDIRDGLIAAVNANPHSDWSVSAFEDDSLFIEAEPNVLLSITLQTTFLTIPSVKIFFYVQLTEDGPIVVPAEVMDTTTFAAITETNNQEAFSEGRNLESDADYRNRIATGITGLSTGTILNIEGALLRNVPGVSFARTIENTTDDPETPDGLPLWHIESIVLGGTDEAVAQEVWRTKGAGIPLHGNTSLFITDSAGRERYVSFTRPVPRHFAVRVQYEEYEEELVPGNLVASVQVAVFNTVNATPLGVDMIPGRLYCGIYAASPGIGRVIVEIQELAEPGDTPDPNEWSDATIAIPDSEYASTTVTDIYVETL
jgi:hypothetical protein